MGPWQRFSMPTTKPRAQITPITPEEALRFMALLEVAIITLELIPTAKAWYDVGTDAEYLRQSRARLKYMRDALEKSLVNKAPA